MTSLAWLAPGQPFPPTRQALDDPAGLLAAGGDLSVDTLLRAYRAGIFPWYSDDQPILWWTPDPRLVLFPGDFHLSRRLRRTLTHSRWRYSLNTAFEQVVRLCATTPRHGQRGTWITADMARAYQRLHQAGHAHSLEIWQGDDLVGGIYGVRIGRVFFGESMFSLVSNASKAAMATLCRLHDELQFDLLDCQVESAHLLSLGATSLARADFEQHLARLTSVATPAWPVRAPAELPFPSTSTGSSEHR